MVHRTQSAIIPAVVTAAFTYATLAGATFTGVLLPGFRLVGVAVLVLLGLGWLLLRRQSSWVWHGTPLDGIVLLWLLVIGASWLFNIDQSRRIAIGVWFVGLYVLVWFGTYDLLANRAIKRDQLVDAVLIAGMVVVLFGFFQVRGWFSFQLPLIVSGVIGLDLPRPGSVFENPNSFAGFLVVLLPLAMGAWLQRGFFARVILSVLIGAGLLLLALTFSRAAWIGAVVAFAIQGVLVLSARNLLDPERFYRWWSARSRLVQAELSTTALLGVLLLIFMFFLIFLSFREGGRGVGLRSGIFGAALTAFSKQPVVGHGLFTFGELLAQAQSMPPETPHSHAHSVPFHVLAELGFAGAAVLAASGITVIRTINANWQASGLRDRLLLSGACGALGGFAVHHLFDLPAMMPALALTGLVTLAIALFQPRVPVAAHRPMGGRTPYVILTLVWLALMVTALWVVVPYNVYVQALQDGFLRGRYVEAARAMQAVIDTDPTMPVYHYQRGYLLGLAASEGDQQALQEAVSAFRTYVELEPAFAPAWANLAALHAQAGDYAGAAENMAEAVERAPDAWQLRYRLGDYLDAAGNTDEARAIYEELARTSPEVILLPDWNGSALREEIGQRVRLSALSRVVLQLLDGDIDPAEALWATIRPDYRERTLGYAVDAWIFVLRGDFESARLTLDAARAVRNYDQEEAWAWLVESRLEAALGNSTGAQAALERAQALVAAEEEMDYRTGENWHHVQFLRLAARKQFLPQVGYSIISPLLRYVLTEISDL